MQNFLLFDLDGTLVDSFEQITNAANTIRNDYGIPHLNHHEAMQLIGLPASRLFDDIDPEFEADMLVAQFREVLHASVLNGSTLYPGVTSLLHAARGEGWRIAVATSKPQDLAEAVVANCKLAGLIDVVSGVQNCAPKPSPDVLFKALEGSPPGSAVMIGDRPEDMQAALAAGLPAIGIAQTAFSAKELEAAGAKMTFDSFEHFARQGLESIPTATARFGA